MSAYFVSDTTLNILNILYRLAAEKQIMRWVVISVNGKTETHRVRLTNLPKVITTSLNYPN